ncbi:MAG: hypothetical protein ABI977_07215 [Acidobacteriota bacterium]
MAFSDYKNISQVQKEFRIRYQEDNFIAAAETKPSPFFLKEFEFSLENIDVYTSEGARAEAVIFPILREVYKSYHDRYSLWIQKAITYNERLNGTPDYLIGTKSSLGKTVLEAPLVVIAEAKKNDFEQGWGQCLAVLIAAQKINGNAGIAVYGVVTDGKLWEFGELKEDVFTKNIESYTVDHLAYLFGALNYIFQSVSENIPKNPA